MDRLVIANPAARFSFLDGNLIMKSSQVSNALPFVVGDGTHPATLRLREGTNIFADGLIISSNATLLAVSHL